LIKNNWNKLAEKPAKTPFKNRFYLRFVDNLFHKFLINYIDYITIKYFKIDKNISIKLTNLFILFIESINKNYILQIIGYKSIKILWNLLWNLSIIDKIYLVIV
jgi:hypothetical protein